MSQGQALGTFLTHKSTKLIGFLSNENEYTALLQKFTMKLYKWKYRSWFFVTYNKLKFQFNMLMYFLKLPCFLNCMRNKIKQPSSNVVQGTELLHL